ncbi:MAG: hypothetical protein IKP32_02920 [Clostridia bacterium]|nr:hypothetical protein [Clostridia bacterium]
MSPEKSCSESPFSALSYQEQQDRWLEWRSRQLDYQPADRNPSEADPFPPTASMPLRMPNMALAAPTRHRELDQVISRHAQALRKAGAFQPLSTK